MTDWTREDPDWVHLFWRRPLPPRETLATLNHVHHGPVCIKRRVGPRCQPALVDVLRWLGDA